ncbi:MAG: hypothetical protein SAJ12_08905 [Jaaginema sp. PMC 1079.18]|nr:hypothetical protein [Jaaginema sp. PMC 1080.18]MEC4851119.1 hypothetical protein [Jaaginema sp. PMC 1079.18]MEC4867367.1 hypothetical protein [Jaaginema sp. PMC 1078.18]
MHLSKLLCYTCSAIALGGMSAQAQDDSVDILSEEGDDSIIAGEDLRSDRALDSVAVTPEIIPPESLEFAPESVSTIAIEPIASAVENVANSESDIPEITPIAANLENIEEFETELPAYPYDDLATTATALESDRITVTPPEVNTNPVEIADAGEATCVAMATPEQIAQGFNDSTCPRPRRYNDVEFTEDYQTRSSPAMSIYIPVGYGADNNTIFFTGNYQSEVRVDPGSTFNGGLGIGLGDADKALGAELSYAFANNRNFGEGGFNGKIHRRFPGDISVAAGWNGFLNFGRHDWEHSLYGAVTKVFRTQDSLDKPFSRVAVTAGVGTNQFRSNGARIVGDNNANVFGNVAVRVVRPVSFIAEWTGQDLGLGLSIAPFANIPFVITPAVRDVVGNEFSPRFVLTSGLSYQF